MEDTSVSICDKELNDSIKNVTVNSFQPLASKVGVASYSNSYQASMTQQPPIIYFLTLRKPPGQY